MYTVIAYFCLCIAGEDMHRYVQGRRQQYRIQRSDARSYLVTRKFLCIYSKLPILTI